jgi:hypothetical protein
MPEALDQSLMFRCCYAELLRHFMSGRLVTDEYERRFGKLQRRFGHDEACEAIFLCAWHFYDDIVPHRMTGKHRLTPELRRRVARWIVFLRTGLPLASVGDADSPTPRAGFITRVRCVYGFLVVLLSPFVALIGLVIGAYAFVAAWCIQTVGVMLWFARVGGVDDLLEPPYVARALSIDVDDPWPFGSMEELNAAASLPTYLHG